MAYNQRAAFDRLKKAGFFRTLNIIFPVRKEISDTTHELKLMVGRKISFDLGTPNLRTLGSFDVFSTNLHSLCTSGVLVMKIAKIADDLTWLRLGERCFDVKIKLGESHTTATAAGSALRHEDYSKVTQTMIQETLPKFLGFIKQNKISAFQNKEDAKRHPEFFKTTAICHDIVLKRFDPPSVELQIRCGAGFIVETFVNDLAVELGTVAHVTHSHCYRCGPFTYEDALPAYAISWEACKKKSEKYHDELRAYNNEVKNSLSRNELELFLNEKLLYRLSHRDRILQAKFKSKDRVSDQAE